MIPTRWQRVRNLFHQALDLPDDQRAAFLDSACAEDPDLREQVARLLALDAPADSFLEPPAPAVTPPARSTGGSLIGATLGRYHIRRRIATGGMGEVYEAQQKSPSRIVALKIIRPELVSPTVLRRFEFEAQTLATLRHPGVAQIFEAGTFDLGDGPRPFFAMEFIDGLPLLEYVEQQRLDHRERIRLFIDICDAVQHAHLAGVIHRDLKPANVLIDPSGRPKVLDFGVARVIDRAESEHTELTLAGQVIGTLAYLSPEQLAGDPDEIGPPSDVYALGVVLYRLLTGQAPHDFDGLPLVEIARLVTDRPARPAGQLHRSLRGDVETILGKALETDPDRRYSSAGELAADLERHLTSRPIEARPPTTVYQLSRFVRRNRGVVAGLSVAVLTLLIGATAFAWQWRAAVKQAHLAEAARGRARLEQRQAEAANEFLKLIFDGIDPHEQGRSVDILSLVDDAADDVEVLFGHDPVAEAAVHNEIGTIYYNLRLIEPAEHHFSRALSLRREHLPRDDPNVFASLNNLGLVRHRQGGVDEAVQLFQQALDGRIARLGEADQRTLASMSNLALALRAAREIEQADTMLRRTLRLQEQHLGPGHNDTITSRANLAGSCRRAGRLDEAESLLRRAHADAVESLGSEHVTTLLVAAGLAGLHKEREAFHEAIIIYRDTYETMKRVHGETHADTLIVAGNLAQTLTRTGRDDEAAELYRTAATGFRQALGPDHRNTRAIVRRLGRLLTRLGRHAEAEHAYRELYASRERVFGSNDPRTLHALNDLIEALEAQSRDAEAESLIIDLLDRSRRVLGPGHPTTRATRDKLAELYERTDRSEQAAELRSTTQES